MFEGLFHFNGVDIQCAPRDLVRVLGNHWLPGDGNKISRIWEFYIGGQRIAELGDWKVTSLYDQYFTDPDHFWTLGKKYSFHFWHLPEQTEAVKALRDEILKKISDLK